MGLTKRAGGLGILGFVACACLALLAAGSSSAWASDVGYQYFVYGDPADATTATTPGLLLAGGATDQDDAMKWMIDLSGGGDFVVLAASGTDDYDSYIYNDLGGVNSCETFIFGKRSASYDPFLLDKLRHAEAIFIDGGNQWLYYKYWQGTPVEEVINEAARTKPVGGISAGLAVQGEFAYVAELGTIVSRQALANPFHSHVTLVNDFLSLPYLADTITDSHFVARDRMGRHVTFLARIVHDGWAPQARGIAVDESNTLVVDEHGQARMYGAGAIYFTRTNGAPQVCEKNVPLTYKGISVYRLSGDATFDLTTWKGRGGAAYSVSAIEGVLSSTQPGGSIY